jgi:hypothetical protein
MKHTVVWLPSAEADLAGVWLEAPDRQAVADAADDVDRRLRYLPEQQGESRPEGRRMLIVPPLAVIYRVSPADCLVRVLGVWRFR